MKEREPSSDPYFTGYKLNETLKVTEGGLNERSLGQRRHRDSQEEAAGRIASGLVTPAHSHRDREVLSKG